MNSVQMARRATTFCTPDEWFVDYRKRAVVDTAGRIVVQADGQANVEFLQYIAAVNPQNMKDLVDYIEELENRYCKRAGNCSDSLGVEDEED